jgi:twinkle protein
MSQEWGDLGIDTRGKTAGEVKTRCPWCSEGRKKSNDPCLSVNLDEGVYHCHHCGEAGSLRREHGPRPAAPKPAYRRPEYQHREGDLGPKAQAWLIERGITATVWERNRLGMEGAAIAFPYYRGGEVINIKHRAPGKKFWMVTGAELLPYGLDHIAPGQPLVWVEGEMDKLACEVAGIAACVSVPNGAPSLGSKDTTQHFAYLEAAKPLLDRASRHIIAVDNDDAGRGLADELIRRLGREKCWRVTWPDCKDANELLLRDGPPAVAAAIADARPVPVAGLFEAEDFRDAYLDLYDHGMDGGEHPGCATLARHYRVKPGSWTLLTGIPSHGKSAFLDWLLLNLTRKAKWPIAIFSPENQPIQRHIANLSQILAGKPFDARQPGAMTRDEAERALRSLQEHFSFILPPEDAGWGIDTILGLARSAVYRRGIRGLVIDPWNELEHLRPAGVTETEHVSTVLTQIRRFAREHAVHVWLVAHPTKLQKDSKGEYPVPTPYDISGSAHFRNKADMALCIWRDVNDAGAPTQVHIQKVRFRESGELGMVPLWFDRLTGRYTEYPIERRYE